MSPLKQRNQLDDQKHCTKARKKLKIESENQNKKIKNQTKVMSHICDICSQKKSCRSALIIHMRTHTGEKPYTCNICHKSFSLRCTLLLHMRTHTGEKPYTCNICHQSFSQKSNLCIHMRTHTGEKPYTCNICHQSISRKSNLRIHMRTHTGEKPYTCNICHQSFAHNTSLLKHMRIHTQEKLHKFSLKNHHTSNSKTLTEKKIKRCDVCYIEYHSRNHLVYQSSRENKIKQLVCKTCKNILSNKCRIDMSFKNNCVRQHTPGGQLYKVHDDVVHVKERSFICNFCDQKFASKFMLIQHNIVHATVKLYRCDEEDDERLEGRKSLSTGLLSTSVLSEKKTIDASVVDSRVDDSRDVIESLALTPDNCHDIMSDDEDVFHCGDEIELLNSSISDKSCLREFTGVKDFSQKEVVVEEGEHCDQNEVIEIEKWGQNEEVIEEEVAQESVIPSGSNHQTGDRFSSISECGDQRRKKEQQLKEVTLSSERVKDQYDLICLECGGKFRGIGDYMEHLPGCHLGEYQRLMHDERFLEIVRQKKLSWRKE